MTIRQILRKGQLQTNVDEIKRFSAIDIDFLTNDGEEDATQLNVEHHILTKAGTDELADLFHSLIKEFHTKDNKVLSCTVVATADTRDELIKMGY